MKTKSDTVVSFVGNFKYLYKNFSRIYSELTTNGNYKGDILIITSLFAPTLLIKELRRKNIHILRFKKIKFNKNAEHSLSNLNKKPNRHTTKNFQWHKLYLFHKKIKKWKYIFYLDINMTIHDDINELLNIKPTNKLLAREDGYPEFKWKLKSQFDSSQTLFRKLSKNYNLENNKYFQTGLMFFDTSIICSNTFHEIVSLVNKYPISVTNEQGILNLYFIDEKNIYESLVYELNGKITYFYWKLANKKVMITKAKSEQLK